MHRNASATTRTDSSQVIAAIRDESDIEFALTNPVKTVFLLAEDIRTLKCHCQQLHDAGKQTFLHFDLVNGLKGDASGVAFVAEECRLNGMISTKPPILKLAKANGLLAIQRVFVLDSSAFKTGMQHVESCRPDFVEVLPGVSQKIIRLAVEHFQLPIIAGGLIQDAQDIRLAIQAGASAVSTSRRELWK